MAILNFTLSPEALSKLHDALACLGKFSESVSIEAVHDKVCHTILFKSLVADTFIAHLNSSQFV
jgi:cell cycle checkpoint control protein RAD9A